MNPTLRYFGLRAENSAALDIVKDPVNVGHRVNGTEIIVHLDLLSKRSGSILSLGRDSQTSDIILSHAEYSRQQCHFYLSLDEELVLQDDSAHWTTNLNHFYSNKYNLHGRPRQRAIPYNMDTRLFLRDASFILVWYPQTTAAIRDAISQRKYQLAGQYSPVVKRLTTNTPVSSSHQSSLHVTRFPLAKDIEYHTKYLMGKGDFGSVAACIDLETGLLYAVKKPHAGSMTNDAIQASLRHEVENHIKFPHHDNIAKFVHSQGWTNSAQPEIFMRKYDGNLGDILGPHICNSEGSHPNWFPECLKQVLSALMHLHQHDFIHGNLKAKNILFRASGPRFYLADFGISKVIDISMTSVWTRALVAPEIVYRQPQTSKTDIWSLGIVILEALGLLCLCGIRHNGDDLQYAVDCHRRIAHQSHRKLMARFRSMLSVEALNRPTAVEMYKDLFPSEAVDQQATCKQELPPHDHVPLAVRPKMLNP